MAKRILSAFNAINDFVERNRTADETDFFLKLRDEVSGAEVGDYSENYYIDIIYGDYIFTVYWTNGKWMLSDNVVLLADDDNNASHIIVEMTDVEVY